MKNFYIKLALFLALTLSGQQIRAQLATAPEPTLESPFNTMFVHLYYLQSESYEPEVSALTIVPGYDSLRRMELAIKIKQVFDGMGLYVQLNNIPQNSEFIDSTNQKHFYTPFPGKLPEVYLELIDDKWYYSYETTTLIDDIHNDIYPFGFDFLSKFLPKKADQEIFGLALWQHLGILVIIGMGVIIYFVLLFITRRIALGIAHARNKWKYITKKDLRNITRDTSAFIAIWLSRMFLPALQLPIAATKFSNVLLGILMTLFFMLFAVALVNLTVKRAHSAAELTDTKMDEQLLPIVSQLIKIGIGVIGVFYILNLLDVNVTALIAGVSIGGLALALAAQDTAKNLIGSVVIFIDKPFQIGDYIIAGGEEGTVIEVGFRSTRIMTIDTSIISIPNGQIANMSLTNLGLRESRIFNISIALTYDTPRTKLEEYIERLRRLVHDHEMTKTEPYYIHLRELADSSINIMFRCYLMVPSYGDELALKEELLFEIIKIAEEVGVEFAFPSSTIYFGKGENAEINLNTSAS